MADGIKLSELTQVTEVSETDFLPIVTGNEGNYETKTLKVSVLLDNAGNMGAQVVESLSEFIRSVPHIRLSSTSILSTEIGDSFTLTAAIYPSGSVDSWESSDTLVATVSSQGVITIIGLGKTIITVTSGTLSATCSIVVEEEVIEEEEEIFEETIIE